MSYANLKVGARLGLGFGLVLIILSVIAVIGVSKLSGVNEITNRITTKDWTKAVLANQVIDIVNDNALASYELFLLTDKTAIARTLERIERNKTNITAKLEQLEGMLYLAEGKAKLATIRETRRPYVASFTRVAKLLLEEGRREEASRVMTEETMRELDAFMAAINDLVALQGRILEKSADEAEASYQSGRTLMIAISFVAVLFGIVVAWFITRSITGPLREAS